MPGESGLLPTGLKPAWEVPAWCVPRREVRGLPSMTALGVSRLRAVRALGSASCDPIVSTAPGVLRPAPALRVPIPIPAASSLPALGRVPAPRTLAPPTPLRSAPILAASPPPSTAHRTAPSVPDQVRLSWGTLIIRTHERYKCEVGYRNVNTCSYRCRPAAPSLSWAETWCASTYPDGGRTVRDRCRTQVSGLVLRRPAAQLVSPATPIRLHGLLRPAPRVAHASGDSRDWRDGHH